MKLRIVTIAGLAVLVSGVAVAQTDVIAQRKAMLKQMGDSTKPIAAMMKGEAKFDQAVVQKSLASIADDAKKLPALFPADSKTGGDTAALPKIWDDKAKFDDLFAKLAAAATAAQGSVKDEASLKASMGSVFGTCKSCHDDFRAKKS
ncbi:MULTISPECIES: c-type cytochrome [Rhodopseudomonas]|jgi:cytochrome c556|uniref:Cytochrome c class II n=1 Tax=Rhodopseudomonas palustris (strain DX-1) TaxID=652103 RepID=E6VEI8_RHOPX|nr:MULTISPECIES: cytochrome c [Rhodopseudomonas]NEW87444.1 cytochrome c [Rhodopseudomonas sp. WA056]QDL97694.1 cytochrome c [Rhodopseudomonas palustris]